MARVSQIPKHQASPPVPHARGRMLQRRHRPCAGGTQRARDRLGDLCLVRAFLAPNPRCGRWTQGPPRRRRNGRDGWPQPSAQTSLSTRQRPSNPGICWHCWVAIHRPKIIDQRRDGEVLRCANLALDHLPYEAAGIEPSSRCGFQKSTLLIHRQPHC